MPYRDASTRSSATLLELAESPTTSHVQVDDDIECLCTRRACTPSRWLADRALVTRRLEGAQPGFGALMSGLRLDQFGERARTGPTDLAQVIEREHPDVLFIDEAHGRRRS